MNPKTATLLPLRDYEVQVVIDALVAFAEQCDANGDPCGDAPVADRVAERARGLESLVRISAVEQVKAIGLGHYADRPQG